FPKDICEREYSWDCTSIQRCKSCRRFNVLLFHGRNGDGDQSG
ncbi:unnamed protein product, partial [Allacma fusca]